MALLKSESESTQMQLENKVQELQREAVTFKNEIGELKNTGEQKIVHHQQQAQKDRESFKQRVADAEKKAKESDAKRTQMLFDIEKEKARWQMEFDNIMS